MAVYRQVLLEGIDDHRAAFGDHLEGQTAPGGPVRRAAPAAIDGGKDATPESDHLQTAGLHLHFIGVEDPVGLGVNLGDLVTARTSA